jgi:exosortase F-associated protein
MNRSFKIVMVVLLFGLLIVVRFYENDLFYDPLIRFFKVDHSTHMLPEFDMWKLLMNVTLRFFTNTAISLLILWFIFMKKEIIKISIILYLAVFVALLIAFIFLIFSKEMGGHLALFYVRRFLIQPIFLLLLIPAFYFQKKI